MRRLLRFGLAAMLLMGIWLNAAAPAVAATESPMFLAALPGLSGLFSGTRPDNLGVKEDGQLAPCPSSPNCVVSRSDADEEHEIAPLAFAGDQGAAMDQLKAIVTAQPGAKVITASDDYLYAEFESKLMGFVDDVEFYLDPSAAAVQVRSASRLGQSDLGVNRKRIEAIRAEFSAQQTT
ncbi:DUF1499 domain-containing protein [filamentous cyanobacterium CCP5]|nr:DUF1499 domain-containing protein [filamentous cyanobacterium CCP5]